ARQPGQAMARVFAKLGAEMPALTPSMAPTPKPESVPPVPPPTSAPPRTRPVMTTDALEALAAGGDSIFQAELAKRRAAEARQEAAAAIPPPATTAELLERLPEDPTYPPKAAQLLAVEFDDERSWGAFHGVCQRAYRG